MRATVKLILRNDYTRRDGKQRLTLDFIERFHAYEIKQGNLESTIYKKHANLKFLIGRAVLKEKLEKNPYERFTIKKKIKAQNEDVLTEQEINKLHEAYKQNIYLGGKQKVLRNFLFSCYTSLSYAEFDVVAYADLKKYLIDKKEYLLLCNKRVKNGMIYKIPIVSHKVKELLGTGKDFQKIFTSLTNQATNRYLKEIMKDLKIDKTITFHRGRHSFRTIADYSAPNGATSSGANGATRSAPNGATRSGVNGAIC